MILYTVPKETLHVKVYGNNVHVGKVGYQTPGSGPLALVHSAFNDNPRNILQRVITLIKGRYTLMKTYVV